MAISDLGWQPLSLTGLSLALCQRLTRIENEPGIYLALDEILEDVCKNFELDAAALVLRKPHQPVFTSFLHDVHSHGLSTDEKKKLSYFLAQSVVPEVALRSRCMSKADVRHEILGDLAMGQRTRMVSMLAVPAIISGEVVGILLAFRSEIGAFCDDDQPFFQKIAALLVEDSENAFAYLRLAKDPTTGFYNRRVFFEAVVLETARARRYQAPLSALIIEVEALTSVDEGPKGGPSPFIKRFAQRIVSEVRQSDIVARASDSAFLFLQPMTNAQSSFEFARRICAHFQEHPILLSEALIPINISIGISSLLSSDDEAGAMLLRADQAVNAARKMGLNQIIVHPGSNE